MAKWWNVWQRGVCMAKRAYVTGDVHGKDGMCGRGSIHAGETATEVGGTHPTGMYSYSHNRTNLSLNVVAFSIFIRFVT